MPIDHLPLNRLFNRLLLICVFCALKRGAVFAQAPAPTTSPVATASAAAAVILTPPSPHTPLVHGPKIFGVRPGSPFLYAIPATGDRPIAFAADGLPVGLALDAVAGQITGGLAAAGTYPVTLHATNSLGTSSRAFKIVVGDDIGLTPPMGWNSYNCWGTQITQQRELEIARDLVKSGLNQHGWTYVNMDGGWEGRRGGPFNAIQPNSQNFQDIKAMADEIHKMGLKVGIYSTPWVTAYGGQVGGSSENALGLWDPKTMLHGVKNKKIFPFAIGKYHFFTNDAKQWAAWGMDYVKWDWDPTEVPETQEMADALRASGRDIFFSLSNNGSHKLFKVIGDMSKLANSWRIGGDIRDRWDSLLSEGFHHDEWAPFARPGHWNDPDMFEIGTRGGGKPKKLTPDEQYLHVSQWCLLSAPMLLGCDLDYLDDFTLGLLSNDEVIDINQDELGKQATSVFSDGTQEVYAKPLADGSWAAGLYNLGTTPALVTLHWSAIQLAGKLKVRDLWRQKDLGEFSDSFTADVNPHGVVLVKISPSDK